MPNWQALKAMATKQVYRHPMVTTALGAGLGAGAGKLVAPEEHEGLGTRLGLLAGGAASLAHPGVRQALGNWARRQAFAYTGRAPKALAGDTEKYLHSIQSHQVRNPEVSLLSKAWRKGQEATGRPVAKAWKGVEKGFEKVRRAVGRPAREVTPLAPLEELKAPDQWKGILEAHRAGMSSLPARFRLLRQDPKEFARRWWQHGGKADLMQVPLWTAPTLMGLRGQSKEEKKKSIADTIGGTAGWLAFSGLPSSVWLPASILGGHLAGRAVGDTSAKPKRYEGVLRRREG